MGTPSTQGPPKGAAPKGKPAPDLFDAPATGINASSRKNLQDAERFGLDLRKGSVGPFSVQAHPDGRAIDVANVDFGNPNGSAQMQSYVDAKLDEARNGNPNDTKHILYDGKIYGDWNGWKGEPIEVGPGQKTYGEVDTKHLDHVHIETN